MLELIKPVLDVLTPLLALNRQETLGERKRFSSTVVEPSFVALTRAHQDYVTNFTKLFGILRRESWPTTETIDWLRTAATGLVAERDRLRQFGKNVQNFQSYFRRSGLLDPDQAKIHSAFHIYCSRVEDYFRAGTSDLDASWYSAFVEALEHAASLYERSYNEHLLLGEVHANADRDRLLANLRQEYYGGTSIQASYSSGKIFTIDLQQLGIYVDPSGTLDILRDRYQEASTSYEHLISLCSC